MYTIGQVSELFQLPVSTLRYYDKEGLFPEIKRSGGIRHFDTKELEALRLVECLKKTGMEIKNIKQFMQWCTEGSETYPKRLELIQKQKLECVTKELKSGDMVVMVTDGVLDALPAGEQEKILDLLIQGTPIENPNEFAHYLLEKVLELGKNPPEDDMTVLVAGIWNLCYN